MINIFDLYEKLKGRVNVQQGGHIKPSLYIGWVDDSQLELMSELIDDFQKTQLISEKATPFLVTNNVLITQQPGRPWDLIKKPEEYLCLASARIIKKNGESCLCSGAKVNSDEGEEITNANCNFVDPDEIAALRYSQDSNNCEVSIKLVTNDRWGSICNHRTKKPTSKNPIISQFSEGYRIAPKGASTAIVVDYFRRPKKPVFNFNIIDEGLETEYIQYVEAGSQHLEWSDLALEDLMLKVQMKYNIFTGK